MDKLFVKLCMKYISHYCNKNRGATVEKSEYLDGRVVYKVIIADYEDGDE